MVSRVIFFFTLLQLMYLPGDGQIVDLFTTLINRNSEPNQAGSFSGNQSPSYSGNQPVYYSRNSPPPSPCPQVFQYQYNSNEWTGQLSVPPSVGVDSNTRKLIPVKVEIQLVLPARLPNKYVGKLELAESNQVVWEKLKAQSQNNPIFYRVHFPLTSPLPFLTMVIVNGILHCSGSTDSFPGRVLTTITLNHTFYPYSHQLNVGGSPSVSNIYIEGANSRPSSTHNMGNQPQTVVVRPAPEINYNTGNVDISQHSGLVQQPVVEANRFTTPVTYITRPTPATTTTMVTMPSEPSAPQPVTQKPQTDNFSTNLPQGSFNSCGKPVTSNFLIVNGDAVTKRGEWPWMVAIFQNIDDGVGIKFYCGGTLVTKYYVVTAAHCTKVGDKELTADRFTLYLGKFNLNKWTESGAQLKEVKNIYINPEYNSNADADLAILELSIAAEYGPYVQPACMWPSSTSDLSTLIGKLGTVVGWGLDENNKISSSVPKQAQMPIVSQEECLRSEQSFNYFTSSRTFCAGFRNGTGPCNGDSGGGLVFPMPDEERGGMRWFLRGVVSTSLLTTGKTLCDLKNYVIFTDITKHYSWLSQFVGF